MAWTPAEKTPDLRLFVDNLLAFIAANQADALAWANNNAPLRDFVTLHNSAYGRVQVDFPALMISEQRASADYDSDLVTTSIQLSVESAIDGNDADETTSLAMRYARAIESLILNAPSSVLCQNTNLTLAALMKFETNFDTLRARSNNEFLQVVVTTANFTARLAGY